MNRPDVQILETQRPYDVATALRRTRQVFHDAGFESAHLDARVLTAEACSVTSEDLIVHHAVAMPCESAKRLEAFVARRLNGEPVSRIVGYREFWGLRFAISPATLDPRPETELLVETALDFAKTAHLADRAITVLDLGTGSGCILAALLAELPAASGVGIDLSLDALAVARANLQTHGLGKRAQLVCSDWTGAVKDEAFDIVVCNPPYIASADITKLDAGVRHYDPHAALEGGADGLASYRRLAGEVLRVTKPGGFFAFETGYSQASAVKRQIEAHAADKDALTLRTLADLAGNDRVVAGVRHHAMPQAGIKKNVGVSTGSV